MKQTQKIQLKRKPSRNEPRDAIDIEELEAETARIHREIVSEKTIENERHKDKRTVSDNTRPIHDQQRIVQINPAGFKVVGDKQVSQPNVFSLKRGTTHAMMTDRSHHAGPIEATTEFINTGAQSSRRHYNAASGS